MTTAQARMKLTVGSQGGVKLAYVGESPLGDTIQIAREFTCPSDGGYVIEHFEDGGRRQVCDGLTKMGETLRSSSRDTLAAVIRREYRTMKAAISRDAR
jgi:hypothetical protein